MDELNKLREGQDAQVNFGCFSCVCLLHNPLTYVQLDMGMQLT
jgi:hypothetical protein